MRWRLFIFVPYVDKPVRKGFTSKRDLLTWCVCNRVYPYRITADSDDPIRVYYGYHAQATDILTLDRLAKVNSDYSRIGDAFVSHALHMVYYPDDMEFTELGFWDGSMIGDYPNL